MIRSIKLADVATYTTTGVHFSNLKKINFIYGANGCGKTTASTYLSQPEDGKYQNCQITWDNDRPLSTLVYNKAFREKNFGSSDIAGVFTLGQATKEQLDAIKDKKSSLQNEKDQISRLTVSLNQQTEVKNEADKDITERCWKVFKSYESEFRSALTGSIGSKVRFRDKMLSELSNVDSTALLPLEELQTKGRTLLGDRPPVYPLLVSSTHTTLSPIEDDCIWSKVIIGKSDVAISELISHLGNNDWVNQGRNYIRDDSRCPFCQQNTIDEKFKSDLERYFDDSFLRDIERVRTLEKSYRSAADSVLEGFQRTLDNEKNNTNTKLDTELFQTHLTSLENIIKSNHLEFISKSEKASLQVEVASSEDEIAELNKLIKKANDSLNEHNKLARDFDSALSVFVREVWRFLINQVEDDLKKYNRKTKGLTKAVTKISESLSQREQNESELTQEIRDLSRNMTSVQPTVDEINRLLVGFGFLNFRIAPSATLPNHYCIERLDGEQAKDTLSEGEVTFITFLYFYQLTRGSFSEEEITEDRVVVIDDPISSLDSNVLYIVSALVKDIIREIKAEPNSSIKQLILLTHNVYFHKEASFQNGRSNGCKDTNFWILRKANNVTTASAYEQKNPIESSYELLWRELKERNTNSGITIQNTMRRIIENYFKILGRFSDEDILSKFENLQEQQICNSLLYWINDGSHCLPDDLYVQHPDDSTELYMSVFKKVFDYAGHLSHYNMMMGEEIESTPVELPMSA
ncbi:AAA family ATPase [Vibrio mediterranei]|uniref:AAA family ATPase n=1 Tax=Vibrio mediterranei TaxID=689 RepID=UPI00148E8645|nr:AAA family ATPase [Vibrio mediterranei]NOH31081.1 AAA family ATPase [Vibrio mediterranei]